jgi:hypothetical protein
MNNTDDFISCLKDSRGDFDRDGVFLEFAAAKEGGETINRDVGFYEGGEDDRKNGKWESKQLEEGDSREDNFGCEGSARNGGKKCEGRERDSEWREGPEKVGGRREVAHASEEDKLLVVANVKELGGERVFPCILLHLLISEVHQAKQSKAYQLDRANIVQDFAHNASPLIFVLHLLALELRLVPIQ